VRRAAVREISRHAPEILAQPLDESGAAQRLKPPDMRVDEAIGVAARPRIGACGRPVTRILVTHFHPDHIGQAGWLTQRWNAPLWMTQAEWLYGRHQRAEDDGSREAVARAFYTRAGVSEEQMPALLERVGRYRKGVEPIPAAYWRIFGGETIRIGNRDWQIIIGEGHCPEHACLACPEDRLLISGDIILPRISPNVSLWPQEPDGDPLARYLGCLDRFAGLPDDTLVLPSHDTPFTGVHERISNLRQHHQHRLDLILEDCARTPRTGVEVMNAMFTRKLDMMQLGFAIGEALAHQGAQETIILQLGHRKSSVFCTKGKIGWRP